ncbi:MAG: hypothetical protein K0S33_1494 [Bacteroidetes bacterium]|jgi:putative membrane protein|nr:hypothetical protein [Bacteroidota bacterium]
MTSLKKITVYALAAGFLCLVAPSCSNEKDSKEIAEDSNDAKFDGKTEKDADYLANSYLSNLFEIQVSQHAAANAYTADVKELAAMLVEKHTKMNNDIRALAEQKSVTLPTDLTDDQRDKITKLSEKTGIEYDKEYTSMMKDKHEDAVKTYSKIANNAEDAEVKNWASNTITEVQSHLGMVQGSCNRLKDMK